MELLIFQYANHYSFRSDSNIELFIGKLNSVWLVSGQKRSLVEDLHSNHVIATSKTRLKLFPPKAHFDINYKETFFQLNYRKRIYSCSFEGSLYELFPHRGYKTSIFRDGMQIGYFEQQAFNSFDNCFIKTVLNNNVDLALICTFILAINCDFSEDRENANIDFGNIGYEAMHFDNNWKPI